MIEIVAILVAALGAGLLVASLASRVGGVRAARGSSRRVRAADIMTSMAKGLPQTSRSLSEAERDLARCGLRMSPSGLLGARIVSFSAGLVLGLLLSSTLATTLPERVASIALGVATGLVAPQLYLLQRRRQWREEIDRELPNALDLLTICVQAGSTFESGIRTVCARTQGALSDALAEVVQASSFMPTTQALRRLAENAEVRSLTIFVASLIQAEASGIQLTEVLRTQAASVRAQRRLALEEKINELPLKMTFPLIFIFSSLLIMLLAPVVTTLFAGLTSV